MRPDISLWSLGTLFLWGGLIRISTPPSNRTVQTFGDGGPWGKGRLRGFWGGDVWEGVWASAFEREGGEREAWMIFGWGGWGAGVAAWPYSCIGTHRSRPGDEGWGSSPPPRVRSRRTCRVAVAAPARGAGVAPGPAGQSCSSKVNNVLNRHQWKKNTDYLLVLFFCPKKKKIKLKSSIMSNEL